MTAAYERQKQARKDLKETWRNLGLSYVIHYSCESFYDRPNGASPRITSIAIRNLRTDQTASFSIHKYGELEGKKPNELDSDYDALERKMLEEYFDFIKLHKENAFWIHWNMRDENYGFYAIEHRLKVLGGEAKAVKINDDRKLDLSAILIGIYGKGYIPHPRMEELKKLNTIESRNFKTGKEEAELFSQKEYVALHQSTLSKVDVITCIYHLACEDKLKTKSSFWQRHPSILSLLDWIFESYIVKILTLLTTLGSFGALLLKFIK